MKELTKEEFLELFHPSVHKFLILLASKAEIEALVAFENTLMDSSKRGERAAVAVGPGRTFKSVLDCDGKWLNDLPSQRQYPVAFIKASNLCEQEEGE